MKGKKWSPRNIAICDTTLRDGEQMPGVVFSPEEKLELAKKSSEFGSKIIEVMPAVSKSEQKLAKQLVKANLSAKITASTLLRKKHVELALDCGVSHITLFTSLSDIHLKHKLNITREANLANSLETVDFAREQGLTIAFAGEDSTRADINYLVDFINALSGKIDYFLPCDTLGCLTPFATYRFIKRIKKGTNCPIALHVHNDFGLATANTLAGLDAGAEMFSGTFNGIGERCGNAPIEEVCTALKYLHKIDLGARLEMLTEISRAVENYSGASLQKHKPVVGKNAFCHESGIHVDGIIKYAANYENFDPAEVGQKRKLLFGKHSGCNAFAKILNCPKDSIKNELFLIKILSEKGKKSFSKRKTKLLLADLGKGD